jgi:hypothetical protein
MIALLEYTPVRRLLPLVAVTAALALAPTAAAEMIGGNPGPQHNYVCPNADGKPPLDCFFDAVSHLYTMCKHVKSIEIIEFGYEKSLEGFNGAKSEYCLNKQKLNMTRPYQSALREVTVSRQAVDGIRSLHEFWIVSLTELAWKTGETDEQYKERTQQPYAAFSERIVAIKTILETVKSKTKPAAAPAKAKN